jgi:16S rRNA (cytosine967-C5)-methyltransferase
LAPGGILVYSTCSLEPEENSRQIERLCLASSGLRLLATSTRHPVHHSTDGAFAAALQRPG